MKLFYLMALAILPSFTNAQDSTKPALKKVTLAQGTPVSAMLMQEVSSKNAYDGQILDFILDEPLIAGDTVLAQRGAKITGKVVDAEKRKGLGKAGKLQISIDYLFLPGGKSIRLSNDHTLEGKNKLGTAITEAVLLTPLFLLKKGKNITLKHGQIFKAMVEQDYQF